MCARACVRMCVCVCVRVCICVCVRVCLDMLPGDVNDKISSKVVTTWLSECDFLVCLWHCGKNSLFTAILFHVAVQWAYMVKSSIRTPVHVLRTLV